MSGLKQLRNRVKSIKSTQKITKAMKVVSAAKLQRVKEKAEGLNDYARVLGGIIKDLPHSDILFTGQQNERKIFSKTMESKPHLMIIISSERGLCGAFNSYVVKLAKKAIAELHQDGKQLKIIVIGQKGYNALKGQYQDLIIENYKIHNNDYESVILQLKQQIINLIQNDEIGSCSIYYNYFQNAITQIPSILQVLPIANGDQDLIASNENDELVIKTKNLTREETFAKYEYDGEDIVKKVLDMYISGQMEYVLLQSKASEEGARMTAMDNASKNAGELIDKLTLQLNRSRQTMITTELIEIIAGAEAV